MRALAFGVLVSAAFTRLCSGQVVLPPKGEGSFSITYQNVDFTAHFLDDGSREPPGSDGSHHHTLIGEIEYGLTDRIAISLRLPYTLGKYTGSDAPLFPVATDDRRYHGTFQDFRAEVAVNLVRKPVIITPIFALVVPSHDYAVVGEAAPGRGINEYWAGIGVGRWLSPVLPRTYVQAQYVYAFVERVLNVPTNRSNLNFAAAYFVKPRFSVNVVADVQRTHGGLLIDDVFAPGYDPAKYGSHDRLLRADSFHMGGGVSVSVTHSMDVQASIVKFISGSSTHYGWGTSIGASWSFQTRRPREHAVPAAASPVPPVK